MNPPRWRSGFLFGLGLLTACAPAAPPTAHTRSEAPRPKVYVQPVVAAPTQPRFTVLGRWQARRSLRLHNPEAGLITEVTGYEGDQVAASALLVRFDARRAQVALRQAQAAQTLAQTERARLQQMGAKLTTAQALQQAENALAQAQADTQLAQIRLADHTLTAPFRGLLSERKVEPGDSVASNTLLLTLYDPGSLVLRVEISEQRLIKLDPDAPAQIQCPGQPPQAARLLRRHPTLNPAGLYGVVEYQPTAPTTASWPGASCTIQLTERASTQITLPIRAVQQDETGEFVWVIKAAQQVERRTIRSGSLQGDQAVIEAGLAPGDQVVVQGMADLRTGATVQVVPPPASATF